VLAKEQIEMRAQIGGLRRSCDSAG
jgi:hypothetical protein